MPLISSRNEESTPICRCRVLYLGSAVPHVTKDGLQGIQEPLRELYPEQGALGARGIDSWLSVWSNGLLLENVDENYKKVTRFFPIDSLHYCAAVRYVLVPEKMSPSSSSQPRFLPLDSPFARSPNPNHPPLFAAILRRTTGIKVLECHAFICKREMAANALVRCCFHAYADFSYAKQIENGGGSHTHTLHTNNSNMNGGGGGGGSNGGGGGSLYGTLCNGQQTSSNSIEKVEGWRRTQPAAAGSTLTLNSAAPTTPTENGIGANIELSNSVDDMSIYNGDENHKVWAGSTRDLSEKDAALYGECGGSTMRSSRSSRPRQITNAAPPPPPPPPPATKDEKSLKKPKERSRRKKLSEGSREDITYYMNGGGGAGAGGGGGGNGTMMNGCMKSSSSISGGTMMRGYPKMYQTMNGVYANGTMLRPAASMNGFHAIPGPPPPHMMMVSTTLPHPPRRISTGSYNKPKHPILVQVPPHMLPQMMQMPPGPHPHPHQHQHPHHPPLPPQQPVYIQTGRRLSKHHQPHHPPVPIPVSMEEPIYMPSARPMSPIASYQPGHFPHEAYLMEHYASMDTKTKKKKSKSKKESSLPNGKQVPSSAAAVAAAAAAARSMSNHNNINNNNNNHHNNNIINNDDDDDDELEEGDSAYNTGIYKRKGHLNERAFSYSIRQEHRSRSYGSLSNLKFAPTPVVPNGVNKEEIKKEREIMQMMQDLELSGDELERSEVPAGIYQQNKSKSTKLRR